MFSAYYTDQSNRDFNATEVISEALTFRPFDLSRLHAQGDTRKYQQNDFLHLQKYCPALKIRYLLGQNHDTI